jgi:hypothetical protein
VKRATLTFVFLLCSAALFAQSRGVPASVTSLGSKTVAPSASVTSLGPNGYNSAPCLFGCFDSRFRPNINFQNGTVNLNGRQGGGRGRHHGNGNVGTYVYAYPYPVAVDPGYQDQEQQDAQQEYEAEPPAQTIFDRRGSVRPAPNPTPAEDDPRYGQHYLDSRERRAPMSVEAPRPAAAPVPDPLPIIVVFKDGRQKEISNYAIVGDTLYDLSALTSHKIKLADVDLKATADKNEERGVEFNLPANLKPKA